ncbi:MAG: TrmB family transcriptional regulator [Candidatus Lokiarchaeota archaeon]|nr:TrmB family transcriptional regulator [Candidatus Lokiarchaeota archaeon]
MTIIEKLEENLKKMNFTKYEAKALVTLIKYNNLDASELAKYSNVPQPKVYETMEKLNTKGYIDIISEGRAKFYKIRPKHSITQIFDDEYLEFKNNYEEIKSEINTIYSIEKDTEIPFIGISGEKQLQGYMIDLIEQAENRIVAFLHHDYYTQSLIEAINRVSKKKDIHLIFHDKNSSENLKTVILNTNIYYLKDQIFTKIKTFFQNIPNFIPNIKDSYGINILTQVIDKLNQNFGLLLDDNKKSIFIIPFPIKYPIAIVSTLPDLVNFHMNGVDEILKNSIKL